MGHPIYVKYDNVNDIAIEKRHQNGMSWIFHIYSFIHKAPYYICNLSNEIFETVKDILYVSLSIDSPKSFWEFANCVKITSSNVDVRWNEILNVKRYH